MTPADAIGSLIAAHPDWVNVGAVIYLLGSFAGHILRVGWPDEMERPRWVKILMGVCDALQGVFFAPVKAAARKL
jgi:NADH:ubiquinone oxidoreductase subunit B-like Fe-S oxidoreductase